VNARGALATATLVLGCGSRTSLTNLTSQPPRPDAGALPPCVASDVDGYGVIRSFAVDDRDVLYFGANHELLRHDSRDTTVLDHYGKGDAQAIAVDAERVYVVLTTGAVRVLPRDGGAAVTLATGATSQAQLVAPFEGDVIVVDTSGDPFGSGPTRLLRIGSTGALSTLWQTPSWLESVTFDHEFVYAAVGGSAGVARVDPKDGAEISLGASTLQNVMKLAVDATRLYLLVLPTVMTMPKSGGVPTPLFQVAASNYGGLAADGSGVFVTGSSGIPSRPSQLWRVSLDGQGTMLASSDVTTESGLMFLDVTTGPRSVYWLTQDASYMGQHRFGVHELCK
jgi:hypothetical protein